MGKTPKMKGVVAVLLVLCAFTAAQEAAAPQDAAPAPATVEVGIMPPTRAAANKGRGVIQRDCMNECGGLCRTLCSKFKALKVCNGCVRGCINKCGTGEMIPNNPYFDPFHVPEPGSLPSMGKNATKPASPAKAPTEPSHRV